MDSVGTKPTDMDPIDTSTSNADAIKPNDSCAPYKGDKGLRSPYTTAADDSESRVVRARQITARAFCKLDQGDVTGGKEELRQVMQLLDGELEAGQ